MALTAILAILISYSCWGKWENINLLQVEEGDFLEIVTQTQRVVCHFYHQDFERCKVLDKHLQVLARKHFDTRFIKLSAPVSDTLPPCSKGMSGTTYLL